MPLSKGDAAPKFELPHKAGETVDVGQYIGSEPVVLLFFPLAFSPVCTDEMCAMRDDWSEWDALDAKVFGVSVDSPFITDKFREELNIPFPILSDFNAEVVKQYGGVHDDLFGMKNVGKRAAYVVGSDGTVKYDWVSDDPGQMPDLNAVRDAVAAS